MKQLFQFFFVFIILPASYYPSGAHLKSNQINSNNAHLETQTKIYLLRRWVRCHRHVFHNWN